MTSKYKVASNVTCSETNAVEYLKTLFNIIKVDDLKDRIQHFVERVDKLEERINNSQTNENLIQKIEALETKLQDVYERTINYNRGTILFAEYNRTIAVSPYITYIYTNPKNRAIVKLYDPNDTLVEDVMIDWKSHASPGQTMEDLRLNLEKTLNDIVWEDNLLYKEVANNGNRITQLEEALNSTDISDIRNDVNVLTNTEVPEIKNRIDELESIVFMPPTAIEPTE